MDPQLRVQLDTLANTAAEFAAANHRRNKTYNWITPSEAESLANLRAQLAALEREEAKSKKGLAA